MPFINAVDLNVLDGMIKGRMELDQYFNIIIGENGTGKTRLLEFIKNTRPALSVTDGDSNLRIQVINPKRNMERKTAEVLSAEFRKQTKLPEQQYAEQHVNWQSFAAYPTIGELYFSRFETLGRLAHKTPQQNMEKATEEFNEVVAQIFEKYSLKTNWMDAQGRPNIEIIKNNLQTAVKLEDLSTGEQEILSLAAYIKFSADKYDVFLIDEPEVHLNWSLEKKLFEFLESFSRDFKKQLIIVSHSRAALQTRYRKHCTFLIWADTNKVVISKTLNRGQTLALAGEAIDLVVPISNGTLRFVSEDLAQSRFIEAMGNLHDVETEVVVANNKQNVLTFHRLLTSSPVTNELYFVIDSDNEGSSLGADPIVFISDGYCFENYLLKPFLLAAIVQNRSEEDVSNIIVNVIRKNSDKVFKNNKHLSFLIDGLNTSNLTETRLMRFDASEILKSVLSELSISETGFEKAALTKAIELGRLADCCNETMIQLFEKQKVENERLKEELFSNETIGGAE